LGGPTLGGMWWGHVTILDFNGGWVLSCILGWWELWGLKEGQWLELGQRVYNLIFGWFTGAVVLHWWWLVVVGFMDGHELVLEGIACRCPLCYHLVHGNW